MRRLALLSAVFVTSLLHSPSPALAQVVEYPLFALPDGTAATLTNPNAGKVEVPLAVETYDLVEEADEVVELPASPPGLGTHLWGYAADFANAPLHGYDIGDAPLMAPTETCFPNVTANGRGLAFDPMDGNLWISWVNFPLFQGDGLIHKVVPPNVAPGLCPQVGVIPFGDGPGGTIQDDIGAMDVDEGSKHIWAAGYKPVVVGGAPRSYIYRVNRNNGKIINSCWVPFQGGGVGNDTLSAFRSNTLPGSSKYLLTDAGEIVTSPNSLMVIDQASCHSGRQATIVASVLKTQGMTGIDFEHPGLLNTDGTLFFNNGNFPFSTPTLLGATGAVFELEDISLCGFRSKFGGDGNDMCPY